MGGKATARKYKGTDHYKKIGSAAVRVIKEKYGNNYFKLIRQRKRPSQMT